MTTADTVLETAGLVIEHSTPTLHSVSLERYIHNRQCLHPFSWLLSFYITCTGMRGATLFPYSKVSLRWSMYLYGTGTNVLYGNIVVCK
jgi:hypothetical protein